MDEQEKKRQELILEDIRNTNECMRDRVGYRETRFYWLYVAVGAIVTFLYKECNAASPFYVFLYFAATLSIQFLCIGIGWTYFANDIKIQKFHRWKVWLHEETHLWHYRDYKKDDVGLKRYGRIYGIAEVAVLALPSLLALLLAWYYRELMGLDVVCPCCNLCSTIPVYQTICICLNFFLFLVTLGGSIIMVAYRGKLFVNGPTDPTK